MTKKTEKSRKTTVPEWPRRESSPTALKAVAKIGGLSYPHKGKGATRPRYWRRRIETAKRCTVPMISAGKHGRLQRAVV